MAHAVTWAPLIGSGPVTVPPSASEGVEMGVAVGEGEGVAVGVGVGVGGGVAVGVGVGVGGGVAVGVGVGVGGGVGVGVGVEIDSAEPFIDTLTLAFLALLTIVIALA
jgi:hypothetical protein